jgi:hypothetical protein
MIIPLIILNKIYWYLWKINQHKLCLEYHKRIICNYDDSIGFVDENIDANTPFIDVPNIFNWRNLDDLHKLDKIYKLQNSIDCRWNTRGVLSQNYGYSYHLFNSWEMENLWRL